MQTTSRQFRIKAIVDDVNSCECCGKTGLVRTVAIENLETGEIKYFGTTCAMQPAKGFAIEKAELNTAKRSFEIAQGRLWAKARAIYAERGGLRHTVMVPYTYKGRAGMTPESRFSDQPLFDSICKELGGATAFLS